MFKKKKGLKINFNIRQSFSKGSVGNVAIRENVLAACTPGNWTNWFISHLTSILFEKSSGSALLMHLGTSHDF